MEADDGTFLIPYEDWRDNFSVLFLIIDFPDEWTGVRFKSAWTQSNSGGLPSVYERPQLEKYARNPQFYVKPTSDTDIVFSLGQTGGRLPRGG